MMKNTCIWISGVLLFFPDRMLENNLDKVLAGRTGVRFFFPLCGKAVDMKWYGKKHHVHEITRGVYMFTYSSLLYVVTPYKKLYFLCESQASRHGPFSGRGGDLWKGYKRVLWGEQRDVQRGASSCHTWSKGLQGKWSIHVCKQRGIQRPHFCKYFMCYGWPFY